MKATKPLSRDAQTFLGLFEKETYPSVIVRYYRALHFDVQMECDPHILAHIKSAIEKGHYRTVANLGKLLGRRNRIDLLNRLPEKVAGAGFFDIATAIAMILDNPDSQLIKIFELASKEDIPAVINIVLKITDRNSRGECFKVLMQHCVDNGLVKEAMAVATARKAVLTVAEIENLALYHRNETSGLTFDLIDFFKNMPEGEAQDNAQKALGRVCYLFNDSGQYETAFTLALQITGSQSKEHILTSIFRNCVEKGKLLLAAAIDQNLTKIESVR